MKRFFIFFSLSIITALGIYGMVYASKISRTYDGSSTNVYEIYKDPSNYEIKNEKGVSDIIVKENLKKLMQ